MPEVLHDLDPRKIADHFGTVTWCRTYEDWMELWTRESNKVAQFRIWDIVIAHLTSEKEIQALQLSIVRERKAVSASSLTIPEDFQTSVILSPGIVLPEDDLQALSRANQFNKGVNLSNIDLIELGKHPPIRGVETPWVAFYKRSESSLARLFVTSDGDYNFHDPFNNHPKYIAMHRGKRTGHQMESIEDTDFSWLQDNI